MKIYVASSWRNRYQPGVVERLRGEGYSVYDFRHPAKDNDGFHWSEIDVAWQRWTPDAFRTALCHPVAADGFGLDMDALQECDACVLVLPAGRSAHLEMGQAAGAGKFTVVYIPEQVEPELMYRMLVAICTTMDEVVRTLAINRRRIEAGWDQHCRAVSE